MLGTDIFVQLPYSGAEEGLPIYRIESGTGYLPGLSWYTAWRGPTFERRILSSRIESSPSSTRYRTCVRHPYIRIADPDPVRDGAFSGYRISEQYGTNF